MKRDSGLVTERNLKRVEDFNAVFQEALQTVRQERSDDPAFQIEVNALHQAHNRSTVFHPRFSVGWKTASV